MIRILVVDDDQDLGRALREVLASAEGFTPVGLATGVDEALALFDDLQPDIVLADVDMPEGGGRRLAREVTLRDTGATVVAYSAHGDPRSLADMMAAGAVAYLSKSDPVEALLEGLRRAAAGQATLSGTLTGSVVAALQSRFHQDELVSESEIRRAFADDSLTAVFQPIVSLGSRRVHALEALARFRMVPARGPEFWFGAAARAEMTVPADLAAIAAARAAGQDLPGHLALSLNVAVETILSPLLPEVLAGFGGRQIILEITERTPIVDYETFNRALRPLRTLGCQVAIDDVGAGFASLRHILRLQPDLIKLDRELVRGINHDNAQVALARALATFAYGIDAKIVAEGVETESEMDVLFALGVDLGQGYLLGRPQPATALTSG
ncbi:MAG TPA: EAL domain-containing protein [Candidatus Dormibacteraeota bacterium]|jgi:EAL domain-containing protein (putative c-di-GMP-specific phosphodiesterase class I)/CheY-like chemotaxis protein|nr:EAL domain-containing protein [Candidatus Dormibacteraeota bacterium]